jgi:hypothetical protein
VSLAKDELIGVVVAGVVGAAALADFAYHTGRGSTWGTPAKAEAAEAPRSPARKPENDQAAREDFATVLQDAFAQDQQAATVTLDTTTLRIKWEMCSKQMLARLLRDDGNYQVMNIRALSGISIAELKKRGFKKIECDDGRQNVKPSVESL